MIARLFPLLVLSLLIAGCGSLPRPFKAEEGEGMAPAPTTAQVPLRIEAPTGEAPGDPQAFTLLLAEHLMEQGIAAEPAWFHRPITASPPARRLVGRAELGSAPPTGERLTIYWRLSSQEHEDQQTEAEALLESKGWHSGSSESLDAAARVSAAAIARSLGVLPPLSPNSDATAQDEPPRLVVLPIDAPGDGTESLERAILKALRKEGVELAALPSENDILLRGHVTLGEQRGESQPVRITWVLESAADFSEIGTVDQQNSVPAGSLSVAWRETADLVAEAAAQGIVDLLRQAEITSDRGG